MSNFSLYPKISRAIFLPQLGNFKISLSESSLKSNVLFILFFFNIFLLLLDKLKYPLVSSNVKNSGDVFLLEITSGSFLMKKKLIRFFNSLISNKDFLPQLGILISCSFV